MGWGLVGLGVFIGVKQGMNRVKCVGWM